MSPLSTVNISAGLLLYVQDPLNPTNYISENDPRYAVVESWMGTQKEDSIMKANALAKFNGAMSNWVQQAQQADAYGLPRPALPTIPQIEVDQVVAEPDGSYAIKTTFAPVASYPNPLLPAANPAGASAGDLLGSERAQAPAPAVSPDVAALTSQVAALTALIEKLLSAKAAS